MQQFNDEPNFKLLSHNKPSARNVDPFASAGEHYNPNNCPHPQQAGYLPPLINANGNAFSVVLTNKFTVN